MTRLWDKGGGGRLDETIERFTVGDDPRLDLELVAHDALASAAHARMLTEIDILSPEELEGLMAELATVVEEARRGEFPIHRADEDGHTALENRLTERLGDAGRKIHTGRSRNDQVIAAVRLWGREALLAVVERLLAVVETLLRRAEEHRETSIPGYTHTRQAMPSTLGHLFAAHAEGLLDAVPWLRTAFKHLDRSPLGSASGFGVPLPLDRPRVAELLHFGSLQGNTLAVQNDRGKTEALVLHAVGVAAGDAARLAHDLILLSSDELAWIRLPVEVTTGSSIMPQKRNPDVLELVRAGAARLRAKAAEVAGVYAPLPSGYHRDLQLTKAPFLEGMAGAIDLFAAFRVALDGLEVDAERCRAAVQPATAATDEVYRRIGAGTPFRTAYREVGADPAGSVAGEPSETWRDRTHHGAPGALDMAADRERLVEARDWWRRQTARVEGAWALLPPVG